MVDRETIEDDDEVTLPEEGDEEGVDAGSLDNEGRDDAQTGQEHEDAQGEARVSRATVRVQKALQQAQEATDRASRLERELEQERSKYRQPAQPQEESDDSFNARISLLEPLQQIDAKLDRANKRHQRELLIARLEASDAADKAIFSSKAASDPRYKKYGSEVEQILQEERKNGRNPPRETVLAFVLGKKVLDNQGRERAQSRGQENIRRQQARTDSGRSDVSVSRQRVGQGDSLADIEKRLLGKFI